MRGDVIEIRTRGEILLVGGAGTLSGLPAPLRQRSVNASAVQRLCGDTQAIHHLRHFWLRRSHPQSVSFASDRDLLDLVAANVSRGDVEVVVLPAHHARPRRVAPPASVAAPVPPRARIATVRAPAAGAPPALARSLTITPRAAPPAALVVNRMTLEDRLGEVLRRTAGRLPRALGEELLSLVTPESIAIALGLAALGTAAEFTPVGWAADVILAAIAFGFGGLAAVRALGDLVRCFARIFEAQSERDLDEAAEALARAASAITVMGLAAILHEKASSRGRGGGGAKAPVEEPPLVRRSRRSKAPEDARPPKVESYRRPPAASMSNKEARHWYHQQEEKIPSIIDRDAPLATQARQAFEFRNELRTTARDAMQDRPLAEKLMREDPNLTWEQLAAKKTKAGLSGDDLYRAIIKSSQKSRADVDSKLGIVRKEP